MEILKCCEIPGFGNITIENIIFDYNGTIAQNGILLPGVLELLVGFSKVYNIWVLTADTYGTVQEAFKNTAISVFILKTNQGTKEKRQFLLDLNKDQTIAFGNGSNDCEMLKSARIGICVIGKEGASLKALRASDIVVNDMLDGIDLIKRPKALIATLRE